MANELEKTNYINSLFEFYEPLLTKKQANYIQLYYADDFSLGEIAEEYEISRQAVYDNIRRSEKILQQYEDKLNLYHSFIERNDKLDQIQAYVAKHYPHDAELNKMISSLETTEEE
ncbi:MAG: putative DNA-binding protein [Lentilactobacillus buchneri]|jgi:predicted DNA-binding protein YlxM (UPF0122 family)|nr:putative DNA-binding protein [Lentilactobacillus buchneri]MCI1950258.1 putative DNA-binding protein [Lentilactobacillus buchneri]MCI2019484.1 putative DNA-binding protein [Lentilactobacillus buchneri]MCI2027382.1 putative DNA-binding protein [Lentilactobacillus buchneri]